MRRFSDPVRNITLSKCVFVEDVISWWRATDEHHEHWATVNSNEFTVFHYIFDLTLKYIVMVVMKYYNVLVGKEKNSSRWVSLQYSFITNISVWRPISSLVLHVCIISCSVDMGSGRLLFQYFHIQFNSTRNNTK